MLGMAQEIYSFLLRTIPTLMIDAWQEHKAQLRGYVAARVSDRSVVDDIVQEIFLKAHVSLHTVKSPGSIAGWLFRIAANTIADHYRSQKSWGELPEDLAAPAPERNYIAELANCLRPLIAQLPEKYQVALVLSELEGVPQKEVADRLGLSLSGAKSRIQRGREQLRRRLLDCCDIETGRSGILGYESRDKTCTSDCA